MVSQDSDNTSLVSWHQVQQLIQLLYLYRFKECLCRIDENRILRFPEKGAVSKQDRGQNSSFSYATIKYPSTASSVSDCKHQSSLVRSSMQHGMAVNDQVLYNNNDEQEDSGFSSGGFLCKPQENPCDDFAILERNMFELQESACYFGPMDSATARSLLKRAALGTFLIRDSSDSKYLYSLSVKTERGATSVRIRYDKGLFQFDSDDRLRQRLPQFESVMSLVEFHTSMSRVGKNKNWRWEDNSGKKMMKVTLTESRKCEVSSLAHLVRVRINKCLENVHLPESSVDQLPMLPTRLKDYLRNYPYRL